MITRSDASIPQETAGFIRKVNTAQAVYADVYKDKLTAETAPTVTPTPTPTISNINVAEKLKITSAPTIEENKTWFQKFLDKAGFYKLLFMK